MRHTGSAVTARGDRVTLAAIAATITAFSLGASQILEQAWRPDGAALWQVVAVLLLFAALAYGNVVYLLARFGRLRRDRRPPISEDRGALTIYEAANAPRICVLIPSYKEELRVIRQTVLSAALSEYPSRRIVVLIDDPCTGSGADLPALVAARALIADLHRRFHEADLRYQAELSAFTVRSSSVQVDAAAETRRLAALFDNLASWVERWTEPLTSPSFAHVDVFFNEQIIGASAKAHRDHAAALRRLGCLSIDELKLQYRRLAALLHVPIASFERKAFANLSHAPSKAMNLNSYIGLLGRSFKIHDGSGGRELVECSSSSADLIVPAADYLLTLDADSLVRNDYLLTLGAIMTADDRIAVAQTPYSTHPGAPGLLERCAGAQTDVQYLVHQGFTYFDATYWVGANALLRVEALKDIQQTVVERGVPVQVFIQDKTVIEDTGSTLDLVRRGWTLHNHPQRLAYSATPPDFGALLIQRRRWANGGLIIVADLLRYLLRPHGARPHAMELLIRAHYLLSPTLSTLAVILLALLPLDPSLATPWLILAALPYFALYAIDLKQCGYDWRDFARLYALNLMLIPVNAAGVLHSVRQILQGGKSPFARTPKVGDRTASPATHVAIQLAMPVVALGAAAVAAAAGQIFLAAFALFNAACLVYGLVRFLGLDAAWEDMRIGWTVWRRAALAPSRPLAAAVPRVANLRPRVPVLASAPRARVAGSRRAR